MKTVWSAAAVCAAAFFSIASGTGTNLRAEYPRRTPVVEAVQKTRAGIVSIKVTRSGGLERSRETTGSGVVVDERGYLVTSRHVVAGASRLRVTLADGTELPARLVTA